jgi:hypothetical protein
MVTSRGIFREVENGAMSQTRYVRFGSNGFWLWDPVLGVFLKYLIDAAKASPEITKPWLEEPMRGWCVAACVSDVGYVVDDEWSDDEREKFLGLAEEACAEIGKQEWFSFEEMLGWQILDREGVFPRGDGVTAASVLDLGRAIIALVRGELPKASDGKEWFYGPYGRDEWDTRE